jgi:hypothetical protein
MQRDPSIRDSGQANGAYIGSYRNNFFVFKKYFLKKLNF